MTYDLRGRVALVTGGGRGIGFGTGRALQARGAQVAIVDLDAEATAAGEGIVRGIERRAARVTLPRRWAVRSTLRGALNPVMDELSRKHPPVAELLRRLDA